MISKVYQLIRPKVFQAKYRVIDGSDKVIVRPEFLVLCHADQRYYQGKRPQEVLNQKLPMALIHETAGVVVKDETGHFQPGQRVVMIPNDPPKMTYRDGQYENYVKGVKFRSSGYDGFLQELVDLDPDRVVPYDDAVDPRVAAMAEFISVAVHGVDRSDHIQAMGDEKYAVWGDGNLAYTLALVIKAMKPHAHITVVGKHWDKLNLFSFADQTYVTDDLPSDFTFDRGFECVGGEGSASAIDTMIDHAEPQASMVLMGVSENNVPMNTRDILEKGLTVVGSSRSGRKDFERAVKILEDPEIERRFKFIIEDKGTVHTIDDLHEVFAYDYLNPYKTLFKWEG